MNKTDCYANKFKLLEKLERYEKQTKNLRDQIQELTAKLNETMQLEEKVRLKLGQLLGFNAELAGAIGEEDLMRSIDELFEQDCSNSMEC